MIKRLVHLGLVDRRRDATDERRVLVTLSAKGAALRRDACDIPARIFGRFGLDVADATALRDDLIRLVDTLDGHPATPSD
jgi:DNA-binding MarR family transcriptional regulator